MQCLEVSCAVRPIYGSLGAKGLIMDMKHFAHKIANYSNQVQRERLCVEFLQEVVTIIIGLKKATVVSDN
jgi:hypothetical protein